MEGWPLHVRWMVVLLTGLAVGQAGRAAEKSEAPKSKPPLWAFLLPRGQMPSIEESLPAEPPAAPPHVLDPALEMLEECRRRMDAVHGYTATVVTQEMVGNKLTEETYLKAKFRTEPFSVYVKWMYPAEGREAIYVEGANQNKILTHGTGLTKALAGTVLIDPDSREARQDCRHSIRELGIGKLIDRLIRGWEFERNFLETEVSITSVKVNDRPCHLITTVHPQPDDGKFTFHTQKVYVDMERMLPIRVECYGYPQEPGRQPGRLLECHTYVGLELNPIFTDLDFSVDNPDYSFSRF